MRVLLLALSVVWSLVGCGSHEVDVDTWRDDLARHDVHPDDWELYANSWRAVCADEDNRRLRLLVTDTVNAGTPAEVVVINMRHACPERMRAAGYAR